MVGQTTLSKFLILHLQKSESESELAALLVDVAAAVKRIASMTSKGALGNPPGEDRDNMAVKLRALSTEAIVSTCECGGQLAGMLSEEMEAPYEIPGDFLRGEYLLLFRPLDGSSNTDINVAMGTIFSVLKWHNGGRPVAENYLQPGGEQVAAGYAIYGPSTMMVITVGNGTHGFTLDREIGNFILTHPDMQVPRQASEFAIDSSRERFWEPPMQRYIEECKAGKSGPRERDFNMRWLASRVANVHRILMRGGVCLYPKDSQPPGMRLLHEACPLAMVVSQAGGLASTGRERIESVEVTDLHQRAPLLLGSAAEVERIERYHADYDAGTDKEYASPLFGERSLFRD